ncbi:MAG: ATP-binding protein [Candidatus Acidiferrum sp.]|jgi:signal transduction histidine kinase
MTETGNLQNDIPRETSIALGEASLESILCTEELYRRPSRPPHHEKENRALVALVSALADSPTTILQALARTILEITQADSAGRGLLTTEDDGRPYEKEFIRKDGTPVVVGGALFETGGNEGVAFVLELREQKRAEEARERLRQAQAEIEHMTRVMTMGQIAAAIAHEVNQPLSGIVTNASTCLRMLDANPPNLEGARETARRTIRDGHRASEVIMRLRALFSKKSVSFERFDLNEAAKEVIALSASELQRNRVILQLDLAADLPPVWGDRIQIEQVILNLLKNGCDAMRNVDDRPRELLIKTERDEEGGALLSVKDKGVGVVPQIEQKLFEAFYTTKGDGMGIGLSVSRSIIESHHGRLWAVRNDGPGSTFLFSIPSSTNT